jgi:hypothetical protein
MQILPFIYVYFTRHVTLGTGTAVTFGGNVTAVPVPSVTLFHNVFLAIGDIKALIRLVRSATVESKYLAFVAVLALHLLYPG